MWTATHNTKWKQDWHNKLPPLHWQTHHGQRTTQTLWGPKHREYACNGSPHKNHERHTADLDEEEPTHSQNWQRPARDKPWNVTDRVCYTTRVNRTCSMDKQQDQPTQDSIHQPTRQSVHQPTGQRLLGQGNIKDQTTGQGLLGQGNIKDQTRGQGLLGQGNIKHQTRGQGLLGQGNIKHQTRGMTRWHCATCIPTMQASVLTSQPCTMHQSEQCWLPHHTEGQEYWRDRQLSMSWKHNEFA